MSVQRGRVPRASLAGFPVSLTCDKEPDAPDRGAPARPRKEPGEAVCTPGRAGAEAHRINQNESVLKTDPTCIRKPRRSQE